MDYSYLQGLPEASTVGGLVQRNQWCSHCWPKHPQSGRCHPLQSGRHRYFPWSQLLNRLSAETADSSYSRPIAGFLGQKQGRMQGRCHFGHFRHKWRFWDFDLQLQKVHDLFLAEAVTAGSSRCLGKPHWRKEWKDCQLQKTLPPLREQQCPPWQVEPQCQCQW